MALLGAVLEQVEHHPADGVGGVLAVAEQVLVGGEAPAPLVHAVGLDQLAERGVGDAEAADGVLEGDHDGLGRRAAVGEDQLPLPLVEQREAVALRLVAKVVGVPAEGVDGVEVGPDAAGQQERANGEVLVVGFGQTLTVSVGLGELGW